MPIKPLEKKTDRSVLFKAAFLIVLIVTGLLFEKVFIKKTKDIPRVLGKSQEILVNKIQTSDFLNNSIKKVDDVGGAVLGDATESINKLTSDAGSFVSQVIYENSIGKIVDQVAKLPQDQQDKIKEQLCR
jgi:hypothetical protein